MEILAVEEFGKIYVTRMGLVNIQPIKHIRSVKPCGLTLVHDRTDMFDSCQLPGAHP